MKKRLFYFSFIWLILVYPAFAGEYTQTETVTTPITMSSEDTNYTNASTGSITITDAGIVVTFGDGEDSFTNQGDVDITSTGEKGVYFGCPTATTGDSFTNEAGGTVNIDADDAAILFNDGANGFTNAGTAAIHSETLEGIYFGDGANVFTNSGDLNVTSNSVTADKTAIYFGTGDDAFTNSGILNVTSDAEEGVYFSGGDNSFTNEAGGTVNIDASHAAILFNDGANNFTNAGTAAIHSETLEGIYFGDGANVFTNTGDLNVTSDSVAADKAATIYFGTGDDAFTNSGILNVTSSSYRGIDLNSGDDSFTNAVGATLNVTGEALGLVFLGGADIFINEGSATIRSNTFEAIYLGAGDNVFTNTGTLTVSNDDAIRAVIGCSGNGADTFTNEGTFTVTSPKHQGINLAGGNNNFTNAPGGNITINADKAGVYFTGGVDTFINGGSLDITSTTLEGIFLGAGNDIFRNQGNITISSGGAVGGIAFNTGDDTFTSAGSLDITSASGTAVDMGAGADTFNLGGALNSINAIQGGADADTLNLGGSQYLTFAGDVAGFETINKGDTGEWDLTGTVTDSTTININSGALYLNGTVPGAVTAIGGGLGVTSPNSIGVLNLSGSLDFGSGALLIDINSAGADLVNVAGTADINGGALVVNPLDIQLDVNAPRQILTSAGGLTGNFASVSSTSPLFSFTADYGTTDQVWLETEVIDMTEFQSQGLIPATINQIAGGAYAHQAIAAGVTHPVITALLSLTSPDAINEAMNTLTSEPMATAISTSHNSVAAQYANVSSRMGIHHIFGGTPSFKFAAGLASDYFPILNANSAPDQEPNALWAKTIYLTAKNDPDDGKFEFETDTSGISIGGDYMFGNFMIGAAGGYSESDIEYKTVPTEGETDTLNISLYGSYNAPKYYIDTILSYSNHNYDIDRYIPILNETANGDYRADEYTAYINGGYPIRVNNTVTITPSVSLQYSRYDQEAYTETGSSAALAVVAMDSNSLISGLGFAVEKTLDYGKWKFLPNAKVMWKHEFCDTVQTVEASFAEFDSSFGTFTSEGYDQGEEAFALTLGGTIYKGKDAALFLNYDLGIKDDYTSHAVTAGVKFYF
ncbi:MAG: autotransporter domain-containing protein [Deltaproteobacteria bacterium]|nr:autotransporter domain-containing protein [Deltaproteobacteria bacterium]